MSHFYLRIGLRSSFPCLRFPTEIHIAPMRTTYPAHFMKPKVAFNENAHYFVASRMNTWSSYIWGSERRNWLAMKMTQLSVSGTRTPSISYNAYGRGLGVGAGVTLEVRPLTTYIVTWPTPRAFALLASVYRSGRGHLRLNLSVTRP
jgi:hypothetical protein